MSRVVVAGLGDTGVLAAIRLARRFDVVGISAKPALVSGQELGNRLARPDHWRRNFLIPFGRFRALDRVRTLHGVVTRVDTDRAEVHVGHLDGSTTVETYDALLISSGVTNGFWRQNRLEDEDGIEADLARVSAQIDQAGSIAVVGGGATGVSAAVNLADRHPDKTIHLFHSRGEALPEYHPRVRRRIAHELERAGVHVHPHHRAVVPDGASSEGLTTGPVEWATGQGSFDIDRVLWAVGDVRPNTDFLPDELLDERGFVRVDENLRVPGHDAVFAVGDVAATDANRSSARNWGYFLAARNIKAHLRGRPHRMKRYRAPEHRWGSILGVQDDGMLVFQPDGRAFRIPKWAVQPLLFSGFTRLLLYRGLRRPRTSAPWSGRARTRRTVRSRWLRGPGSGGPTR